MVVRSHLAEPFLTEREEAERGSLRAVCGDAQVLHDSLRPAVRFRASSRIAAPAAENER
jgi:hypothetical protein